MNVRKALCVFTLSVAALLTALPCFSQSIPSRDQWGEKFNSAGAKLTYKEIGRTTIQGKTVITYSLFASGLPKDQHYVLCALNVGSDPQAVADAYLNADGRVVNVLADPDHHVLEDPINAKVFGGKGEPFQFALLADDGHLHVFAQIVPFPIEQTSGECHLSLIETAPYYSGVLIRITGFKSEEELSIEQQSESEGGQSKGKADSQGSYSAALFPVVRASAPARLASSLTGNHARLGLISRGARGELPVPVARASLCDEASWRNQGIRQASKNEAQ